MQDGFGFNAIRPGFGFIVITDATTITMITNPASWNVDGDYTGLTTGLVPGNYYVDTNTNQFYQYVKLNASSNRLIRQSFNTYIA